MRFFSVFAGLLAAILFLSCENDVKRSPLDALVTDDAAQNDENTGTDDPATDTTGPTDHEAVPTDGTIPTDEDNAAPDTVGADDLNDDILNDDDEVIQPDDEPVNVCAMNGGVCVSGETCPIGYTSSEQFTCDNAICCMNTGATGLRVDVTAPQPIPASLMSIPANQPVPTENGTGTPAITEEIPGPLLAIGLIEENIDGCKEYQTPATGFIVIVQRGNCTFSQKIQNAANAGANALIIYNNAPGELGMNADGAIPTVGIVQEAGQALLAFTGEHPEDIAVAIRP